MGQVLMAGQVGCEVKEMIIGFCKVETIATGQEQFPRGIGEKPDWRWVLQRIGGDNG